MEDENDAPQIYLLGRTYLLYNEKFYIRNDAIIHMAAGDRHTIIVTESGRVYAFGDNQSGQLGLGHTDDTDKVSCIKSLKFGNTGEKIILAACGRESSLVATNQGSLYAFGLNNHCQLGIELEESTTIYPYPIKIEYFDSKISWKQISWKQISMGAEHTCGLTNDGKVYVWGSNEDGQCGHARKYDIIRTPRKLELEYSVVAISCGYFHTALIDERGRLFLFGNNDDRQLGRAISDQFVGPVEVSLPDPVKAVACGNQHTVVLTKKGEVYTCGQGDRGQLGLGPNLLIAKNFEPIENLPKHLTAIAAGEGHTAILGPQGELYVFGDGKHGKLSYETHSNEFEPCCINQFKGYTVLKVVCGGCQTIILAQKKSTENEEGTTDSKTKSIKSTVRTIRHLSMTNRTSIDAWLQHAEPFEISNYSKKPPFHTESNSDSDELSASMKSALMNTRHVEINGILQPTKPSFESTNSRINTGGFQSLKTGVLDHTVPLINMTDDSNNHFSSTDKSHQHDTRFDGRSPKNNSRNKQISDDEESSQSISKQNNTNTSRYSIPSKTLTKNENHDFYDRPSASSTTVSRSSSASSDDNNQPIPSQTLDDLQHSFRSSESRSETINSKNESTKTVISSGTQSGFFARFFGTKSSQNLSTNQTKNSKTCIIM